MAATYALLTLAVFSCIVIINSERYEPNWESLGKRPLPKWFDQSKIGIFMHWGVYSVPSYSSGYSEWFWAYWRGGQKDLEDFMTKNYKPGFTYQSFAPQFTAEFYNPGQWADILQASGAKYVILTTKHHEGYTMWPSTYSWNWNSMSVGSKRDLLGELVTAVRNKTDLHFGTYYSLYEWYNPIYLRDKNNKYTTRDFVKTKMFPELKELVEKYKPDLIWSDGEWEAPNEYWDSPEFLAWLYNDSPVKDKVVTNSRWAENLTYPNGCYKSVGDNALPETLQEEKWESAMTIDLKSWGYRRIATIKDYMTPESMISKLAQIISLGGNIALNIGPTSDGRIEPIFEERLRQLGSWLKVNGEAIYESSSWVHQNDSITPGVWYTSRANHVYAIVLQWPKSNVLRLGSIAPEPESEITMLGVVKPLIWKGDPETYTTVVFPFLTPDLVPCQWGWVLKFEKGLPKTKSERNLTEKTNPVKEITN